MQTLLLALALAAPQAPAEPPPVRNVVLLVADDLGWADLGSYGSSFHETPNLDRLAGSGARFTRGYAACQVCSPTRASIVTGKYPARIDATDYFGGRRKARLLPAEYNDRVALEEVTLAEALGEHDFRTAFVGKWHLGPEGFWPTDQGYEHNVAGFTRGHPPKGYFSPYGMPTLEDGPDGEFLTERLTNEALAWLDGLEEDERFFLHLSYYTVHTPLQTPEPLKEKYRERRDALGVTEEERWGREEPRKVRLVQDHAVYAGMVETLDDSVGRVLAKLDELGVAEETLVAFFSDNGGLSTSEGHPTSNLPLRAGKGWIYEGGIREPLLVRWPGVTQRGQEVHVPVISNDLYPTVLEACGLPARPTQHVDGRSLRPVLDGGRAPLHDALFWHYPHYGNQGGRPCGAVMEGDWKLVEWFETGDVELYHLGRDLGEQIDLAEREPDRVDRMRTRLWDWREEVDANMPRPNPDWEG